MSALGTTEPCRLCGAVAPPTPVLKKPLADGLIAELVRCPECGLVTLAQTPDDFQPDLYAYYERRMSWPKERLYDPITEERYVELLSQLGAASPNRTALDVGCGKGHFLSAAQRAGWSVRGIDLAEGAIQLCKKYELPAECIDFFSPELDAQRFGLVTMFELIEHVPNPIAFLQRAAELLEPGGLIYLTTPNFASLDRRVLGPAWGPIHLEHVTLFTPQTLNELVRRAGLRTERVESRNVSGQALRTLADPRRWRAPVAPPSTRKSEAQTNAKEKDLRAAIEQRPWLKTAKSAMNRALDATRSGSSLIVWLRKD